MNTGRINGGGGIDRRFPARTDNPGRTQQSPISHADSAAISGRSLEFLATVEAMTDRLDGEMETRTDRVESVRRLLLNGELDRPEVFMETSLGMLRSGF